MPLGTRLTRRLCPTVLLLLAALCLPAQTRNTTQTLDLAGLRTAAAQSQFNGVKLDSAGNIYLLLDQRDGVRILKMDAGAANLLAQAKLGAAGDTGVALALDPAGNVYVTGTSTSGSLSATAGAAIATRTDSSTQSFVARFDSALNPVFVTFTGGSRIAATALAATADSVFVTGITYAANLPVTSNGVQQTPAAGSTQNGFVERFSSSGATLVYATYLTGADGNTNPSAIAVTSADDAFVAGSTSSSGFPTVAALVPASISTPSGFLSRLTPAGDAFAASTFVPGGGLTGLALASTGSTLLATGAVDPGQFPVDTAAIPLAPTTYQVLLRLPLDLSSVQSGTVVAPGAQSVVAAAPLDAAWVTGSFTLPAFPLVPLADAGSAFAARVSSAGVVDQTARLGGTPLGKLTYSSLPATIAAVAADASGRALFAGSVQPTVSADLIATQTYDLPLRNAPTPALPSTLRDAVPAAAACTGNCTGSAGYLARLNPSVSAAALSLSADAVPFITVRNLGTAPANNLQLATTAGTLTSNCPATLIAGAQCQALLSGGAAGTFTASASNPAGNPPGIPETQSVAYPAYPATTPASTIVFSPRELDFGIQTATSTPATRTITVSNLGTTAQTFTSAIDAYINPKAPVVFPFTESASDCTLATSTTKTLAAGGTCHISIAFTPQAPDGIVQRQWLIGAQDVALTAYAQAAALSVSSTTLNFGTQFSSGIHLPRYLYLSNASTYSVSHAALALPAGSPFTLTDGCPSTLIADSVCRIRVDYQAAKSTSADSATLTLDQGLSVTLTGQTQPSKGTTGTSTNPSLSVTPGTITFADSVVVTGVSSSVQSVAVSNTGGVAVPLTISLTGDFLSTSSCPASLPAGQTCAIALNFAPAQPGLRSGLLTVSGGSGTTPINVALSGTATAILPIANAAVAFGSVTVGQPATQYFRFSQPFSSVLAGTTGPYAVALVEDAGYGYVQPPASAFSTSLSQACHTCYLAVRFQPTASGTQTGTVTLATSTMGASYAISVSGYGQALTGLVLTPIAQDFGSVPLHSRSGTSLFTLTNLAGSATAVNVTPQLLGADFVFDTSAGATCGGALAYTASCTVQVAFAPTATGARSGTLSFTTAGGLSATAALTGNATPDTTLSISPLSLTFSNVPGPAATTQTVTLTNTGTAVLSVGTPAAGNAAFSTTTTCGTLTPSASCTVAVTYQPGNAAAAATLTVPVTAANALQPSTYTVALSGTYTLASASLQLLPSSTQFGPATVASESTPRILALNNLTGKAVSVQVAIPRQFVLVDAPCATLAAGGSCSFSVAFLPLTNGDIPGTVTAAATPSDGSAAFSALAYLQGYGTGSGALTLAGGLIANGVFSFGQVASGQGLAQTFTLTNSSSADSVTIRRVTSLPPFLASTTCLATLAPGANCSLTVTYTPATQTSGSTTADAGTLTIESDAASSPTTLSLSGQPGPLAGSAATPPLATYTLSQGSLVFAGTKVYDSSAPQPVTISNTGTATLHVTSLTTTADFTVQSTCATILSGASCTFTVASTPKSTGTHAAALEISSDSSAALEFISLLSTATPATLNLSPAMLNFGSLTVGSTATLPVTVTNSGSTAATFTSITATGPFTTGGSCPAAGGSLAAGANCTIQVTFTPTAAAGASGTLSVATSATNLPVTVTLAGTGTQSRLVIIPSALAFGSIVQGASSNLSLTLNNTGTAPVTNLTLAITGDYAVTIPCPSAALAPGATCTAQVTFTPTAAGARNGALIVASSDPTSPVTVPLTGNGLTAGGSFSLIVDGGQSSTVSVASGSPANYQLTLTPSGGFSGTVALTCAPVTPAQYATCALSPGAVTLNGTSQSATATITTITSAALADPPLTRALAPVLCTLIPGLLLATRRRRLPRLLALLLATGAALTLGCGGSSPTANLRYAPAGSYRYQVTATSTSGTQITQTVTLNLNVGSR